MPVRKHRRARWFDPNKKSNNRSTTMSHLSYPHSTFRRIPIEGFVVRQNRRRRRWPMIVLAFILGMFVGWFIRGGGAYFL